jgi:hypothetical protein
MNKQVCENFIKYLGNLIRERGKTEDKHLYVGTGKVNSNIGFVYSEICQWDMDWQREQGKLWDH